MPHIYEDSEEINERKQATFDPRDLEKINVRVLSTSEKTVMNDFVIQPETSLELIFFRMVFTRLRKQYHANLPSREVSGSVYGEGQEGVPFESFQRAFERLFFLLDDGRVFEGRDYDENGTGVVSWGEFFHVYKREEGIRIKLSLCERIYFTFEDPDSSYLAQLVSNIILVTIIVSSLCFIMSTVDECQVPSSDGTKPRPASAFHTIESCCLLLFVVEYVMRVSTCWNVRPYILKQAKLQDMMLGFEPIELPSAFHNLVYFIFSPSNIIDLLAILPGVISFFTQSEEGGGLVVLRLVRLTKIFRAFKNPALSEPVTVIGRTLERSTKALYVLCFQLMLLIVISGSLIWIAEKGRWNPATRSYHRKVKQAWNNETLSWDDLYEESPFASIPHSFWWAIVTATTVGYGDNGNFPVTSWGYMVAVATMSVSLVITALPVGVIGGTFSQVWMETIDDRKQMKAERRTEMEHITEAIQLLDPSRMSRLLFVQVWNHGRGWAGGPLGRGSVIAGPPPPPRDGRKVKERQAFQFMGEAMLELPLDNEPVLRQETVPLVANNDIVKRRVKGTITIRYEWRPSCSTVGTRDFGSQSSTTGSDGPGGPDIVRSKTQMPYRLNGELTVTMLSAEGLINLDGCKKNGGISSPYCMVYVYPNHPADEQSVLPEAWRYPTAVETLSPRWGAEHSFHYGWNLNRSNPKKYSQRMSELMRRPSKQSDVSKEDPDEVSPISGGILPESVSASMTPISGDLEGVARDNPTQLERLGKFRELFDEMKRDLNNLDTHVDRLAASYSPDAPQISSEYSDSVPLIGQAAALAEVPELPGSVLT